jgi:hypothetical protein
VWTVREEQGLRLFENRFLRTIFGPKKDKRPGDRKKLHNEKQYDSFSSPSTIRIVKSRMMRWVEHVPRMGKKVNAYGLLVGKPEGRRPLGRPRRRCVDNIRMRLVEVRWTGLVWLRIVTGGELL